MTAYNDIGNNIVNILLNFKIKTKFIDYLVCPLITRYELSLEPGTKLNSIVKLKDELGLFLGCKEKISVTAIPDKVAVGIDIPNEKREIVDINKILISDKFKNSSNTSFALGVDIMNNPIIVDIAKMPHLLIAGTTGSGKSVCINSIINSLMYHSTPKDVRMILIDPKKVELNCYNDSPYMLTPVVDDIEKASAVLNWLVLEMNYRYEVFSSFKVKTVDEFNAINNGITMYKIVLIIDEFADLMMLKGKEVEMQITRLTQLARAAGIHVIIATQRPTTNVITGLIKSNIPSRISFSVASHIDSKVVLDETGAENLLGNGDMLYKIQGEPIKRALGCYISEDNINRILNKKLI